MPEVIKLELSIAEVNTVLMALARQPYETVHLLMPKIQQQAQSQVPQEPMTPKVP